jgi:hypothetical protein
VVFGILTDKKEAESERAAFFAKSYNERSLAPHQSL